MRPLTIAIASYQRRQPLVRLVSALGAQLSALPQLADNVEIVVVVDGSNDGSSEAVSRLALPVPTRVLWQPNRGLAAARNSGLWAANGEIVWFLDDDLVPGEGLVARHRKAHEDVSGRVVVGPCLIPDEARTLPGIREWYRKRYEALAAIGEIKQFDSFSAANTSAPVDVLRELDGFDERFVGYGMEDYELALRLLEAGVPIVFDPAAVAWHDQVRSVREECASKVSEGRNRVRLAQLRPETATQLFPSYGRSALTRLLACRALRAPGAYRALAEISAWAAAGEARLGGDRRRFLHLAILTGTLAGTAELDSEGAFVERLLGLSEKATPSMTSIAPTTGQRAQTDEHQRGAGTGSAAMKVLDLELSESLADLALFGYSRALAIVRVHGDPIGYARVPVADGLCLEEDLLKAVQDQLGSRIRRHLLSDALLQGQVLPTIASGDLWRAPHRRWAGPWPSATVAICTRDRAEMLAGCLRSVRELDYPAVDILVVDNASRTDATRRLVTDQFPDVRYVQEPRPGLDWARNRAIAETSSELLAFVDDDVVVSPQWLRALATAFSEAPEAMAATGLVAPYELETDAQVLFEHYGGFGHEFRRRWYRVDVEAGERAAVRHGGAGRFGTGANMAFRRRVFDEIGGFDPALDVGTVTNGGGDLEMFFRILKEGYVLAYEPAALVCHRHRRSLEELERQIHDNGVGLYAYLVRSASAYPEERAALVRLGVWWIWWWNARRLLLSLLRPSRMPTNLIVAELLGSIRGLSRYRLARKEADRIASRLGAIEYPPAPRRRPGAPPAPRDVATAVRCVDLQRPLEPIADLEEYSRLWVYLFSGDRPVGVAQLSNHHRNVSQRELAEAVVDEIQARLPLMDTADVPPSNEAVTTAVLRAIDREAEALPGRGFPAESLVSVVVSSGGDREALRRCLQALHPEQPSRPVEVVVVDTDPASPASEVVADFPGVRLHEAYGESVAQGRNRAIAACRGSVVATLNHDVRVSEGWMERILRPFASDDMVMAVTGNLLPAEPAKRLPPLSGARWPEGWGFQRRRFDASWFERFTRRAVPTWEMGSSANAAFRAQLFSDPDIGLFPEPLGSGGDLYLFYRLLKAGHIIVYEPSAYAWLEASGQPESTQNAFERGRGQVAYQLATLRRDRDLRALAHLLKHLPARRTRQFLAGGRSRYAVRLFLHETAGNLAGLRSWSGIKAGP